MIIALYLNPKKTIAKQLAIGIREFLEGQKITVAIDDEYADDVGATALSKIDTKAIDFFISMGGDGTILRLKHRFPNIEAPILGINLGNLGFMADIPVSDIYSSLQDLIAGNYKIEDRIMMEGSTSAQEHCFAVNEMVIHRASNPTLIDLAIHVDGIYLNTFSADGIIVSTPSGSTAYSLAAGGPILSPDLDAFVLTPISPHTISNRPIVLMPQQDIQIQYLSEYDPVEITFDGISCYRLRTGDVFHITKSTNTFRMVNIMHRDYYSILRTKLGWAGKLRH